MTTTGHVQIANPPSPEVTIPTQASHLHIIINRQIVHLKNILRIAQVAALIVILIAITIRINQHQEVDHHINLMTMVMMTSIWTMIMTMRDTRMTRIMPME